MPKWASLRLGITVSTASAAHANNLTILHVGFLVRPLEAIDRLARLSALTQPDSQSLLQQRAVLSDLEANDRSSVRSPGAQLSRQSLLEKGVLFGALQAIENPLSGGRLLLRGWVLREGVSLRGWLRGRSIIWATRCRRTHSEAKAGKSRQEQSSSGHELGSVQASCLHRSSRLGKADHAWCRGASPTHPYPLARCSPTRAGTTSTAFGSRNTAEGPDY